MRTLAVALLIMLTACSSENAPLFKTGSYKMVGAMNDVPTMVTFAEGGRFNGKVVNNMMGSYTLGDGNSISFSPIATTLMMGPKEAMDAEQNLLQLLPQVKTYKMQGDYLILVTDNGNELLFEPYTPEDDKKSEQL